jgi:hypothetical protein
MEDIFYIAEWDRSHTNGTAQNTLQLLPRLGLRLVVTAVLPRDLSPCHHRFFSQVRRRNGRHQHATLENSAAAPRYGGSDFRKCERFIADFSLE